MKLINYHWLCILVLSGLLAACSSLQQMRSIEYTSGESATLTVPIVEAKSQAEAALLDSGFMETGREKHGNKFYLYGESAGEGSLEPGKRQYTTGQLVRIVLVEEGNKTQAYVLVQEKIGFSTRDTQLAAQRLLGKLSAS